MRVCSLFCGIGGIDLAFVKAGHEIVWANDIDKYACMTYRHNFPDTPLVEGDIRSIDKKDIPDFDILTAGFPCQPFSVCGKQKGFSDERGNLFLKSEKLSTKSTLPSYFWRTWQTLPNTTKERRLTLSITSWRDEDISFDIWLPMLAIKAFRNTERELISSRLPIETFAKGSPFPKKFRLKSI